MGKTIIKLILFMGIIGLFSAPLSVDYLQDAEALKAKGKPAWKYGSATAGIVCGDRLCSEISSEDGTLQVRGGVMSKETIQEEEATPSKVQNNIVYENGPYQLVEVSKNLYSFGDMNYFSMVLVTDEGVIIGDPVNTGHSEEMLQAIKEITDNPIKYVIYSHNHWDHSAGGQVFKNEGAIILSHVDARDWIMENSNANVLVPDEVWEGNQKNIVLGDKTLELHHFGESHGKGMTVFYLPDEKIIYIVDIVTPKRIGFTILPDFVPSEWERTLIEVEKLDFETAMFGHKKPFGPASEVTEIRVYLQDLKVEIFRMINEGVNPMMIPSTIELPKYQDWEFYDQWLEMNTWRMILEFHMGW